MPKRLVIFVPGMMGSALRYDGPDEHGNSVSYEVWGSDPGKIIDTLARWPLRLRSTRLQATEVLKRIKGRVWARTVDEPVYGPLLDFCVQQEGLGLEPEDEFIAFPYDWRKDIRESSRDLAATIEKADPQRERLIGLVAHSMGGLICRLLLLEDEHSIALRVRFFLQIASPILGSAKAFHSLREGPIFSQSMDFLMTLLQHKDLQLKSDLLAALRTFPSTYQLLPPKSNGVLLTSTGRLIPAVEPEAWLGLGNYSEHLQAAQDVHETLTKPLSVRTKCVYSTDHETVWCYEVDTEFRIKRWIRQQSGDGTVLSMSAFEGTKLEDRVRACEGKTLHDELPSHSKVKETLRGLVREIS